MGHARDTGEKFVRRHRLGHVKLEARKQREDPVARGREPRQGDGGKSFGWGHAAALLDAAHFADDLVAIGAGPQRDVAKQRLRPLLEGCSRQPGQRGIAAGERTNLDALGRKDLPKQLARRVVAIDAGDGNAVQAWELGRRG